MTSLPPLCLTGASGFVGRHLVERLAALGASNVTILVRDPSRLTAAARRWRVVPVDLARHDIPAGSVPPGSVVLHVAAATGNANARLMQRLNVDATRRLLDAAAVARARHFLFVSSIAAGYHDKRWAPYATTKQAAEQLVAASPTPYTLVRPTMIFGPGSPNQRALERLATLALPLLPGQGDARVQPIHVDDVVSALLRLATEPPLQRVVTVGGPTVLSMHELFHAMRRARGLSRRQPLTIPLEPLRRVLALAGTRLPVNAGQFVAFANDSIAGERDARLPLPSVSLDAMLNAPEAHA